MTQQINLQVTPDFASKIPQLASPSPHENHLSTLAPSSDTRQQLVCKRLLVGTTLERATSEAQEVLAKILQNTQILALFGMDALEGVNQLSDRMLNERPEVNIPEVQEAMQTLSRDMRGIGSKYNPNDPQVLKKYANVKGGILARIGWGKTFLQAFLDDIQTLQKKFEFVTTILEGKKEELLRNVTYYDSFYRLNEQEIGKLIYKIGIMEIIRDLLTDKAQEITVGDANIGDRGGEQQAQLLSLVTLLDNKIIAFKGRLWVAWAMAPQIRTMRAISLGLSARIDQTVGITIPTMKTTIVIWLTLTDAQQAEQFNRSVEETYNSVMNLFAQATQQMVPALANSLEAPALDPRTVVAWTQALVAQADGMVNAINEGKLKRAALENAMIKGKMVIDAATQRVNEAQLQQLVEGANRETIEIAHSVSN